MNNNNIIVKLFTSLKLTVALLAISLAIVFLGTMAQEPLGQKIAVERFFQSFFVDQVAMEAAYIKTVQIFGVATEPLSPERILEAKRWPVFPGGYLIGVLLLINLLSAHAQRFTFTWKKGGIFLTHIGIILLLLGQLLTDLLSQESFVHMERGDRRHFSVSFDNNELVLLSHVNAQSNRVVAIPESLLERTAEVTHPDLAGLKIRSLQHWVNAAPKSARQFVDWFSEKQTDRFNDRERRKVQLEKRGKLGKAEQAELDQLTADLPELQQRQFFAQFFARDFYIARAKEETAEELKELLEMFRKRVEEVPLSEAKANSFKPAILAMMKEWEAAAAKHAVKVDGGRLGDFYKFVVPLPPALASDQRNFPAAVIEIKGATASTKWLVTCQTELTQRVDDGNKTYHISLRPARHYKEHSLSLVDLKYEKYAGTETPKNFESIVLLDDAKANVQRQVSISMNAPLRHDGLTYYQYQMNQNQLGSTSQTVLQVVRNPGWLTPYFACLIVALGLIYQFLIHLVGFARKRRST